MRSLLLVDDHASSRQPLGVLLRLTTDFEEIREASSIAEAEPMIEGIDFAIVDLGLPDGNGVSLVQSIRQRAPSARLLVLTSSSERSDTARAIASGADGVLHKTSEFDAIVTAIRDIEAGRRIVTDQQQADVDLLATSAIPTFELLTPRELDVIECLADGLSDKEIGERLGIGVETVRTHLGNVFGKLGVDSRLQALTFALQHDLLPGRKR